MDAPFLISSTIFGGGGYLALTATTERFLGLEANFSYGGVFAFGFGPLVGQGQITVGVYLNQRVGQDIEIGSTFQVRGSAHVACFGIMASLYVRLTMQNGKMKGLAIFSFSFDLGIHTISFRVQVERDEGARMGQSGGPNGQANDAQPTAQPPPPSPEKTRVGSIIDGREFGYSEIDPVHTGSIGGPARLTVHKDLPDPTELLQGRAYHIRRAAQSHAVLRPS